MRTFFVISLLSFATGFAVADFAIAFATSQARSDYADLVNNCYTLTSDGDFADGNKMYNCIAASNYSLTKAR